ncbi:MAG: hypothetical protein M1828_001393 [Chrysothrix sp. TS-e1954]|nr:MAG: hypothetical protein M1828_001393 [Chrysothrix sp. TS-e1954]
MSSVIVPLHLLLLSPPPWPPTRDSIKATYRKPLSAVLEQLSFGIRKATTGAALDIALPLPFLLANSKSSRSALFPKVNDALAQVYSLICAVASEKSINIEDVEGVDVRVIMLAHAHGEEPQMNVKVSSASTMGPVIDLQTLAMSQRPWQLVYSIDNDEGEHILHQFLVTQDSHVNVRKLEPGHVPSSSTDLQLATESAEQQDSTHKSIAVGGTWDHIHVGHKLLLTMFAFLLDPDDSAKERCLTVGITGDELLQNKKYPELLQSWMDRQRCTRSFLTAIMDFRLMQDDLVKIEEVSNPGANGHVVNVHLQSGLLIRLVEIMDPCGPTITDEAITALVLSAETRSGGKVVNEKRTEKQWSPLETFEVDVLNANDEETPEQLDNAFQSKLSSTSIRANLSERGRLRSIA